MAKKKKPEPDLPLDDALFRELNEEMRQDRIIQFARKYQYYIIGVIVLFVIAFAALQLWTTYQSGVRSNKATSLVQAQTLYADGETEAADTLLQDLSQSNDIYGFQAAMALGHQALATENYADAKAAYEMAQGKSGLALAYRQLGEFYALLADAQTGGSKAGLARLDELAIGDGPYKDLARELIVVAKVTSGDTLAAIAEIEILSEDEELDGQVRNRLNELQSALQ